MPKPDVQPLTELDGIALSKLSAVLGPDRGLQVLVEMLTERGENLRTADDLLAFSKVLTARKGFEGAVGAMLGVTAILRGASARL